MNNYNLINYLDLTSVRMTKTECS